MREYYVPTITMYYHKYKELVSRGYLETTDYSYDVVEYADGIHPLQASRVGRFTIDKTPEIVNIVPKVNKYIRIN